MAAHDEIDEQGNGYERTAPDGGDGAGARRTAHRLDHHNEPAGDSAAMTSGDDPRRQGATTPPVPEPPAPQPAPGPGDPPAPPPIPQPPTPPTPLAHVGGRRRG